MEKQIKRLTISQLRTFKGYENASDEEAEFAIDSLEKISIVFFELFQKKKYEMGKVIIMKDRLKEDNKDEEQRIAA